MSVHCEMSEIIPRKTEEQLKLCTDDEGLKIKFKIKRV